MSDKFYFIGVQGIDSEGNNVSMSAYIANPTEADMRESLEEMKAAAKSFNIDIKHQTPVQIGSQAANKADTQVVEAMTVVRRKQYNPDKKDPSKINMTPCLHFYPAWKDFGNGKFFGYYPAFTKFLNTPEDIAAAEAAMGIKLDEIPDTDLEGAPQRNPQIRKPYELDLAKPVKAVCSARQIPGKDGGEARTVYDKFVSWAT